VGLYGPALGALFRAYKYHGREELEPVLAGWLADVVTAASWLKRVQAVVSVPTHWKHRLGRPLYAADMLAALVARQIHLPHLPILRRVRGGPHQIGLSYTARALNVRGVFVMRKGVTLRNARLLLIDDVKTTGATLEECTKVLRRGGAAEVYGAVVVKAGGVQPGSQPPASI
jgi:ComF family protein